MQILQALNLRLKRRFYQALDNILLVTFGQDWLNAKKHLGWQIAKYTSSYRLVLLEKADARQSSKYL